MSPSILRALAVSLRLQADMFDQLAGAANDAAPSPSTPATVNAIEYLVSAGCAKSRILTALHNGVLNGRKVGNRWLATKIDCDAWIVTTSDPRPPKAKEQPAPNPILRAMGYTSV